MLRIKTYVRVLADLILNTLKLLRKNKDLNCFKRCMLNVKIISLSALLKNKTLVYINMILNIRFKV